MKNQQVKYHTYINTHKYIYKGRRLLLTIEYQVSASEYGAGIRPGKLSLQPLGKVLWRLNRWQTLLREMVIEYSHALNASFYKLLINLQGKNCMLNSGEMRDDLVCVFNIWITNGNKWASSAFWCRFSDSNTSQQPEIHSGYLILRKYQEKRDLWVFY